MSTYSRFLTATAYRRCFDVVAETGHKTLLIDPDFRGPSVRKIFGRIRNVCLSPPFILQDVPEDEAITAVEKVPNLWLATSGPTPPDPSELSPNA